MMLLHWIGGLQVELVVNGSDCLALEAVYRKRHGLTKVQWLNFLQTELTEEKASELTLIKERIKLQGRPYREELDEDFWAAYDRTEETGNALD